MEIDRPFIIATRPEQKYKTVSGACFDVVNIPVTEVHISNRIKEVKEELFQFNPDLIVLTSSTGSKILMSLGISGNFKFICIGEKTASPLIDSGLDVNIPQEKNSYGLADYIGRYVNKENRIALCRSEQHDNYIDAFLTKNGYVFKNFTLYSLAAIPFDNIINYIERKNCVGILFTSSLEAKVVIEFLLNKHKIDVLNHKKVFSIGKMTSNTLKKYRIKAETMASESNFEELLMEITKKYCHSGEWI